MVREDLHVPKFTSNKNLKQHNDSNEQEIENKDNNNDNASVQNDDNFQAVAEAEAENIKAEKVQEEGD